MSRIQCGQCREFFDASEELCGECMEADEPGWTSDLPTKIGWYWSRIKQPNGEFHSIVLYVRLDDMGFFAITEEDDYPQIRLDEHHAYLMKMHGAAYWYGPLTPPTGGP